LLRGNFEYDDDPNALIPYDAITDLFTNTLSKPKDAAARDIEPEKYLTCDAARFGGDYIPIYLWRGFEVYRIEVYQRQGLDITEGRIRTLLAEERIPYSHAIVDENGVGGGLVDHLKGIKGFVANARPLEPKGKPEDAPKEQYENLKAQCTYMFADAAAKHLVSIRLGGGKLPAEMTEAELREKIIEDCQQMKQKEADKDGPKKVVPKDEVKDNLQRSPDFGDSLMMRMFFELKPTGSGFIPPPTTGLVKPFYPGLGV